MEYKNQFYRPVEAYINHKHTHTLQLYSVTFNVFAYKKSMCHKEYHAVLYDVTAIAINHIIFTKFIARIRTAHNCIN